jgi:hypothetical protein
MHTNEEDIQEFAFDFHPTSQISPKECTHHYKQASSHTEKRIHFFKRPEPLKPPTKPKSNVAVSEKEKSKMRQKSVRRTNSKINLLKSKVGLGTPVGNLIILVAVVLLSSTVVLFATNVTASQVQKEKMYIEASHVWYINGTSSSAAMAICNTGPTDIVLTQVNIKGLQCSWNSSTNFIIYSKTNGTIPANLPVLTNLTNTENTTITIGDQSYTFTVAEKGLTIKAGQSIILYAVIPERIMIYDLSTPIRMVVTTTQAAYCTETLAQTT